jgi:hypothetical protein
MGFSNSFGGIEYMSMTPKEKEKLAGDLKDKAQMKDGRSMHWERPKNIFEELQRIFG